jgi:hypothetical protein
MQYKHTASGTLCGTGLEQTGKIVRIKGIVATGEGVTAGDKVEITKTDASGAVQAVFVMGAANDVVGAQYTGEGLRVQDPFVKITKTGGTFTAIVETA